MAKRIFAIAFIFVCTSIAWLVLGATIFTRTRGSDQHLSGRVGSTWGTSQAQQAPVAYTEKTETRVVESPDRGGPPERQRASTISRDRTETVRTRVPLDLEQTRAAVAFDVDHRRKGLLWYSTYAVSFDGTFRFRNTTPSDSVSFEFPLPVAQAIYDDLRVTLNGAPTAYETRGQAIVTTARIPRGDSATLAVAYRSQGLDEWRYVLGTEVAEVRDFNLVMRTNFDDIDFPENTLSPTGKQKEGSGWKLQWRYANLLSGFQIGMDMPQKLQPGPLAGQDRIFRPGITALLLRGDVHHRDDPPDRSAPHELRVPGGGILRVPPAHGLPGRSHLHSRRIPDRISSLDRAGGELSAARDRPTLRFP